MVQSERPEWTISNFESRDLMSPQEQPDPQGRNSGNADRHTLRPTDTSEEKVPYRLRPRFPLKPRYRVKNGLSRQERFFRATA